MEICEEAQGLAASISLFRQGHGVLKWRLLVFHQGYNVAANGEKYQAKSKSNRAVIPWMLLSPCRECSKVEASSERFKPLGNNAIRTGHFRSLFSDNLHLN